MMIDEELLSTRSRLLGHMTFAVQGANPVPSSCRVTGCSVMSLRLLTKTARPTFGRTVMVVDEQHASMRVGAINDAKIFLQQRDRMQLRRTCCSRVFRLLRRERCKIATRWRTDAGLAHRRSEYCLMHMAGGLMGVTRPSGWRPPDEG